MSRRLILIAIALMVATAPTAHEICQVSCASPSRMAAADVAAPAGHEHCALAQENDGATTRMSADRVADCRSQQDDATITSSLIKVAGKAPMIISDHIADVFVSTRRTPFSTPSFPRSLPAPSRTQLRV
jgi:hypothetical protein